MTNRETAIQKRENSQQNVPERIDQGQFFTPLVDIIENNDAFTFLADLPGVKPEDVDVAYENGVLTIDGRVHPRQPQQQQYAWQEYGVGSFHRQFTIDTPVDVDGIKAELKNGELHLYVPKAERARTRKIEVQTS